MNPSISSIPTCRQHDTTACITRGQKRRAATTVAEVAGESISSPSIKQRTVFEDIINLYAASDSAVSIFGTAEKPKHKSQSKLKNGNINDNNKVSQKPLLMSDAGSGSSGSDESGKKISHHTSIYQFLRSLEVEEKMQPLPNYMVTIQKDITANMRQVLIDWLIEVAEEYKFVSDTIYLTVSYVDRYLSSHSIHRNNLQLLGVASMFIASKCEEICPPHVEDFCYITDTTYTRNEVIEMEKNVLKFLDNKLTAPTIKRFLRIFTRIAQANSMLINDLELEFLGCYLAELSLLDYTCVRFLPSIVAASAIFLARFTISPNQHPWNLALQQYSGYCPSELKECVTIIHQLQLGRKRIASSAVRTKYGHPKFKKVASLIAHPVIPELYFEIASR